ncbi:hypothetical protein LPB72_01105 [Hydrogenophaga crassostreae]|uniref:DZANK-type domain-containing protein n=1 Tax=Hydrogenophaga crassostreae TaxID=1763535 RepID=A0A162W5Y9_9BURK|nr:zinc ribbon domain-containing protein [Hydrogenophaga crassostreae]AOW13900.1 hypothetical protein LPB072_14710 [Hydrogenophaga crassostreae]OAD44136.1 hypothetical protein LPB72_01105 [Hydrogenophaga crassostreae]
MELCEACGTENRNKAKFCRGCARPLLPIAAGVDLTDKASNRALRCGVCQAIHSRGAKTCQACGLPLDEPKSDDTPQAQPTQGQKARRWPLLGILALAGAVIFWWGANQKEPVEVIEGGEVVIDAQPALAPEKPTQLPAPAPSASAAAPSIETAMNADEKAHFDELVKREAERAEKARKTIARLAAQEKAASEASAAKSVAAERLRNETARQAITQPGAAEPVDSKTAATAPKPSPPPARVSVEQACAKASNFLSRDLCRVDACREAINIRDPICVWYRKLDEERRSRLAN